MQNNSWLLLSFNHPEQQCFSFDYYMLQCKILCSWQMEETWSGYNEGSDAITWQCQRNIGIKIGSFFPVDTDVDHSNGTSFNDQVTTGSLNRIDLRWHIRMDIIPDLEDSQHIASSDKRKYLWGIHTGAPY